MIVALASSRYNQYLHNRIKVYRKVINAYSYDVAVLIKTYIDSEIVSEFEGRSINKDSFSCAVTGTGKITDIFTRLIIKRSAREKAGLQNCRTN